MSKKKVFAIVIVAIAVAIAVYELVAGTSPAAVDSSVSQAGESSSAMSDGEYAAGDEGVWLRFEGTDIDGPVMQTEDNDYYLRRNEAGEEDVWGCYFLDYECSPDSQNLIIYGHSYGDNIDDRRFSQLKRLNDRSFAEEHNTIEVTIGGETRQYRIFSSGYASDLADNHILAPDPGRESMEDIIGSTLARSRHDYGVRVTAEDELLTLCTCTSDDNTRYVVTAKRIY